MIQHLVDENVTAIVQEYANLDSKLNLLSEHLFFLGA